MKRERGRRILSATGVSFVVLFLFVSAHMQVSKPTPVTGPDKRPPSIEVPGNTALTGQCQRTRERAGVLRGELETSLSAQVKTAAEQYAAKPEPGVSTEKAWGDYAAAASLMGDAAVAAWAGLRAAEIRWSGETVANAGIYLFQLGKTQDALQFLNCAYEMGFRSPYLLEALAVLHQTTGNSGQARQFIDQAFAAAPDDVIIETEASFIKTGQPPPPRPPQPEPDGLDDAIRELEQHAQRALAVIKAQSDAIDQSAPPDNVVREYQKISGDSINSMVKIARDQARDARAATDPTVRRAMINGVLGTCISGYAEITDQMLRFPDSTKLTGSPLLFWADAIGLDASVLGRESYRANYFSTEWEMAGTLGLARKARHDYNRGWDAAYKDHTARLLACGGNLQCQVRETARWCLAWKQLYEAWETASRQRHNTAARAFDRLATRKMIEAENEFLQLRDYAVRQLKKMRFPPATAQYSVEKVVVEIANNQLKSVYDKHLSSTTDSSGTVSFLREQAIWFESERSVLDGDLASETKSLQTHCEPAIRALLELLAQEEWQAYLDHLQDRLSWSVQPKTESEFPCEGEIGPLTIETDLNKPGEGKFDLKWKGKSFRAGGNVSVGGGGITGLGGSVGLSRKTTIGKEEDDKQPGVSFVSNVTGSSTSGPGFGQSVSYGPFHGKAKISLTSKVSPWNNQEYLGIKLKGSAGLGLSAREGRLGVKCYPSSGSVTIYPRALYNDAVKYMSTPKTPPRGGARPR